MDVRLHQRFKRLRLAALLLRQNQPLRLAITRHQVGKTRLRWVLSHRQQITMRLLLVILRMRPMIEPLQLALAQVRSVRTPLRLVQMPNHLILMLWLWGKMPMRVIRTA